MYEDTIMTPIKLRNQSTPQKIYSFLKLEDGWSYGEGLKFNYEIVALADDIHRYILSLELTETDAFPGLDGEVRITAYYKDYYLEITVNEDRSVDYYLEKNNEKMIIKEGVSLDETFALIFNFWRVHCKNLSESSILNTMIKEEDASKVSHLGVKEVSPFLKKSVRLTSRTEPVIISETFTQPLQVSL